MVLPIGPNDVLVDLSPTREEAGFPPIYKTSKHPKKTGPGNIYYFIQELSKPALAAVMDLENKLRIPYGPVCNAFKQGDLYRFVQALHFPHTMNRLPSARRRRHNFCAWQHSSYDWRGRRRCVLDHRRVRMVYWIKGFPCI